MDRGVVVAVVLVLTGVLLVVTAPPDPQYSVSVTGPTDPPADEPVVAFADLSEENRTLFRAAFDDAERSAEPPDVGEMYVSYEGDTYLLSSAAHEGSVLSLLMPPLGGLLVVTGCLVAVFRHVRRS